MFRRLLYRNLKLVYKVTNWNRDRLTPAGMLILGGMFAAGIFGVDVRQSLAFHIFAILLSLLVVAALFNIAFRANFQVRRLLPQYATVNHPLRYRIEVNNLDNVGQHDLFVIDELGLTFPRYEEFEKSIDPQDRKRNRFDRIVGYPRLMALIRRKRGGSIDPVGVEHLRPRHTGYVDMVMHPARRGYIEFSNIRICRSDPMGLVRAMKKFLRRDKLLVLPKTYQVPLIEFEGVRKYQQGDMSLASSVGDSQEFMSLRDYQPGDPLRAIHWRSYARVGEPVVKEFHDEFFVRHGLVLDTFRGVRSEQVFEEAISVAASFCLDMPGQDSLLDLMFVAEKTYRVTSGRGLSQAEGILEMLACVQPSDESRFAQLAGVVLRHCDETSGMVFIFMDWDEPRKALVDALIQRGLPVLVYVVLENEDAEITPGPMAGHANRLVPLYCGNVQENLLTLSPASLDR